MEYYLVDLIITVISEFEKVLREILVNTYYVFVIFKFPPIVAIEILIFVIIKA